MICVNDDAREIIEKTEKAVCISFGIERKSIIERNLTNTAVIARSILFYTLHYDYMLSINKLSKIYGRSPRSVNYVISKIKYSIEKQNTYRVLYERVRSNMNGK